MATHFILNLTLHLEKVAQKNTTWFSLGSKLLYLHLNAQCCVPSISNTLLFDFVLIVFRKILYFITAKVELLISGFIHSLLWHQNFQTISKFLTRVVIPASLRGNPLLLGCYLGLILLYKISPIFSSLHNFSNIVCIVHILCSHALSFQILLYALLPRFPWSTFFPFPSYFNFLTYLGIDASTHDMAIPPETALNYHILNLHSNTHPIPKNISRHPIGQSHPTHHPDHTTFQPNATSPHLP